MNLRLMAWISCGVAVAMMLGGCVRSNLRVIETPTPAVTPLFATDAEALAAATKAYAAYVKVSDQITGAAGEGMQRIAPLVTVTQLKKEIKGFQHYKTKSLASRGTTTFDSISLQSWVEKPSGVVSIIVYLCSDATGIKLVDIAGNDVTSAALVLRYPLEVEFVATGTSPDLFLISRSESWQGKNFCVHS